MMYVRSFLMLALCLYAVSSYKVLKGSDVLKNYAIGSIIFLEYCGNDKLYFVTAQDVLGLIDANTGRLSVVYQLDEDQKILEHKGYRLVVIQKNRDINIFKPKDETYIKLRYSQFLEKQNFKQIIGFKRFSVHDYILTDQFLLKAENPYAGVSNPPIKENLTTKYEIIQNRTQVNYAYYQLVYSMGKDPAIGLVFLKDTIGKRQMCIKRFFITSAETEQLCYGFDPTIEITKIQEIGINILVFTDKKKMIFNNKLQLLTEAPLDLRISFIDKLNILSTLNNKESLKGDEKSQTKAFFNFQRPKDRSSVQIFQKYMLVKIQNQVIANIEKSIEDQPVEIWAYSRSPKSVDFELLIQFENGKVACYKIGEKEKSTSLLWTFSVNPADKSISGQQKQAEQVDLETEQKLIEQTADNGLDLEAKKEKSQNNNPG